MEECAINAAQEDKNRQSAFMGQVRALKIDRLRAVFNKLSAAPESHSQAVQQLLSLIVQTQEQAELHQHMPLLQYTLFQISNTALNDCQEVIQNISSSFENPYLCIYYIHIGILSGNGRISPYQGIVVFSFMYLTTYLF